MSKIIEALEGEFFAVFLQDPAGFMEDRYSAEWIDEKNGVQAIFGLRTDAAIPTVFAFLFMRSKGWDKQKASAWLGGHPEFLPEKLGEALLKLGKNVILRLLRSPMPFISEYYTLQTVDKNDGIFSVLGVTADSSVLRPVALIFKGKKWNKAKVNEWLETRQGSVYCTEW